MKFSILVFITLLVLLSFDSSKVFASSGLVLKPIKLNQLGYKPSDTKVAIVPAGLADDNTLDVAAGFEIIDVSNRSVVFKGKLSRSKLWPYSNENVQQADFSALQQIGDFVLSIEGVGESYIFEISDDPLYALHKAAIKSYYFNRSAIDIDSQTGGIYARKAGHHDTKVKVHASAATAERPEGTVLSLPRGWYDAGDYGKYVVNSGISTYTLLTAYQHFTDLYQNLDLGIVESGDTAPDLLDEIKWNLDWFEKMQDIDGGVYHKLTALRFSDMNVSPENETFQRYVIGKSVTASLNYAAIMAVSSRVFKELEELFPGVSERYKGKALRAYQWARSNPNALYAQPSDVGTGAYDDDNANDEFAWAEAELYLLTGDRYYFEQFLSRKTDPLNNLSWPQVDALGYISLSTSAHAYLNEREYSQINDALVAASDAYFLMYENSAYNVAASEPDFVWGSNGDVLNNGMVLMQGYRITGEARYREAAMSTVDYVLGKNATGYSFVTGFGDKSPVNIHHRPSEADQVDVPVPGFLVGGPHAGKQDGCEYTGTLPATTYADSVCSYSTNEIAINWNAPLVYMLGAAIDTR